MIPQEFIQDIQARADIVEVGIRICYVQEYTGTRPSLDLTDGTTTGVDITYAVAKFVDDENANNLSFNNSLKTDYFAQFSKMIRSMEKVTLFAELPPNEISTFDFFRLIYIDYSDSKNQLKGYYLCQKINEYRGQGSAEMELINVNIS